MCTSLFQSRCHPSLCTELPLPCSKAAALFQSHRSVQSCRCSVPRPLLFTELPLPCSKAVTFQSHRFVRSCRSHRFVQSCRCPVPKLSRSKAVAFPSHRFVRSCCCPIPKPSSFAKAILANFVQGSCSVESDRHRCQCCCTCLGAGRPEPPP